MTEAQTASRLLHTRPELLSKTDRASPDDMREAFEPTLRKLLEHYKSESDLIAVQGEISSMKTKYRQLSPVSASRFSTCSTISSASVEALIRTLS